MTRRAAASRALASLAVMPLLCLWASEAAAARKTHPSTECPPVPKSLPAAASEAMALFLGAGARPLCYGDLNGNGRPELLAAVAERSYGEGLGFYWVTSKSGIFEAAARRGAAWKPILLTSDRIENERGVIGWQRPVVLDGVGLRYTMTHGKGICVQLRRLDYPHACTEERLILVRWDPVVERYEPGFCSGGTAGPVIDAPEKKR